MKRDSKFQKKYYAKKNQKPFSFVFMYINILKGETNHVFYAFSSPQFA